MSYLKWTLFIMLTIVSLGLFSCGDDSEDNNESPSITNNDNAGTVKLAFHIIACDEKAIDSIEYITIKSIAINEVTGKNTQEVLSDSVSLKGKSLNDTISLQKSLTMPPAESYSCSIKYSRAFRLSSESKEYKKEELRVIYSLGMYNQKFVAGKEYNVYLNVYGNRNFQINVK